ncbi:MAG TPA: single-stranded DNA-binding protein [Bacteroidales bacterium]|nr:single-stranded DNA-binding protein [Bacteroidales bacterium]
MKNLRNQVQLIGHLGADPEVKTLNSDSKVARFSLATSDNYTDKDGKKVSDTQWHKILAWNGNATVAEKYLKKGMEVMVAGKLVYGQYEDKDGVKRYTTEIVVHDLLILSKKEN